MKIAFFGLPLAACLLHADGVDIGVAVLSPVAAPGRRRLASLIGAGRILDASFLSPGELCSAVDGVLEQEQLDLVVSWYYTRRLPVRWLRCARLGAIGAHPSLLPRHRGPDPFFWAIDSGDAQTGVTIFRLSERYDEGPILLQERLAVADQDSWQLARALDRPSLHLLRRSVSALGSGRTLPERPQIEIEATWAPEPQGELLRVDWRWPVERVLRRIRALAPVPGLAINLYGIDLFVTRASAAPDCPAALDPGEAAVVGRPARVVIRAGDGAVSLERAVAATEGTVLGPDALAALGSWQCGKIAASVRNRDRVRW